LESELQTTTGWLHLQHAPSHRLHVDFDFHPRHMRWTKIHSIRHLHPILPGGVIATVDVDKFYSPTSSMLLRAGCNLIERHDYSDVNDHEAGFGLGASLGYRKHFLLKNGEIIAA
jgi:hypothetical protein